MGAFASFLRFSELLCNYPRGLVRDPKGRGLLLSDWILLRPAFYRCTSVGWRKTKSLRVALVRRPRISWCVPLS